MSRQDIPAHSIEVTKYEDFTDLVAKFATGPLRFLLIIGDPGTSKSQSILRAIGNRPHLYLQTHATPFGMYHELYKHRGEPVIIDDLDQIYRNPASVRILKCLCNTDRVKHLRWPSRHPDIVSGQVPDSFTTTSPVCLIANTWKTVDVNVQAIEDRAIIVHFVPSAGEIHAKVREWFDDKEVYEFIEEHLFYLSRHSMRHYVKGAQLREAFPDRWKGQLLQAMDLDEKVAAIRQLMTAPGYASDAERIEAFDAAGYGGRATFYRWKRQFGAI